MGKPAKIKKKTIICGIKRGGLKMVDFEIMDKALKSAWIKRLTDHDDAAFKNIPEFAATDYGGLSFLIECQYDVNYYSTNCNTIQIWSWCSRYPSSVGDGYPAIYVASYVGRKSEVKKCWQKGLKNVTSLEIKFVINLLNNKTIILLNLAEYRLILADSAYGLVG